MTRPTEQSSVQEIIDYKPSGWAGNVHWFYEKQRLLRLKKMDQKWKDWNKN